MKLITRFSVLLFLFLYFNEKSFAQPGSTCSNPDNIGMIDTNLTNHNAAFWGTDTSYFVQFVSIGGGVYINWNLIFPQFTQLGQVSLFKYNGSCNSLQLLETEPASQGQLLYQFTDSLDTLIIEFERINCFDPFCGAFTYQIKGTYYVEGWVWQSNCDTSNSPPLYNMSSDSLNTLGYTIPLCIGEEFCVALADPFIFLTDPAVLTQCVSYNFPGATITFPPAAIGPGQTHLN